MIMPSPRSAFAIGALFALTLVARGAEPAIIAKARAFIGPEAALNGVHSIHFVGTVVATNSAAPDKSERAAVEIYFQAPEQQRIQSTSEKTVEVTALDGYDAWQRQQSIADANQWQVKILGADQIKHLRASTWETLGFYRGIDRHGGHIEDQGTATVDGMTCEKLAFIYAPNIIFYRYIDTATGHLVSTETETGTTLREQGQLVIGGIRFPKSIVTTTKTADGKQIVTLTFDKITLNETMPASLFAVPGLQVK